MEKSRKPKGTEGGDLQIRNLDADTLQNLQELKEYFRVGTNSKAVLLAIKQFMTYKDDNHTLRVQLAEAKETIRQQNLLFSELSNELISALNKVNSR